MAQMVGLSARAALTGAVDTLDRRDAIQDRLQWNNFLKFQQNKSCTWVETISIDYRINGWRVVLKRRAWGYRWIINWTWTSNVHLQHKKTTTPWVSCKTAWPVFARWWFFPSTARLWDCTWRSAFGSGAGSTKKAWNSQHVSMGGPW